MCASGAGELVLAHTIFHAARCRKVLLGDALAHLP
jgi:hypothetical protein